MEFLLESSHENDSCAGAFEGSFTMRFERNVAFPMVRRASMPGDATQSSVASREGEVEPRPGVLEGFWQEDVSRLSVFCDPSFVDFGASRKRRRY